MTTFVLDCSVAMGWCFEDEDDAYSLKALESLETAQAVVPALWKLEVVNVLLTAMRKKRITESAAQQFLNSLSCLPIEVVEKDFSSTELLLVAQHHGLTSYDAVYFQLCLQYGYPLATKDEKLADTLVKAGGKLYSK